MIRRAESRSSRSETAQALEFIESGRCPACYFVDQREKSFFFWFLLEQHQEPELIEELDAALGFCPRHTRSLMDSRAYPGTLTSIYLHVVRAARARVSEERPDGPCGACVHESWAAGYAIHVVLRSLREEPPAAAYACSPGFCARHVFLALRQGTAAEVELPLRRCEERVSAKDAENSSVCFFTGSDSDVEERLALRRLLHGTRSGEGRALYRLAADLAEDVCPACLAAGRVATRYLEWLHEELPRRSRHFTREVVGLCALHLAELARLDAEAAELLGLEKSAQWREALGRFGKELRTLPVTRGLALRLRTYRSALRTRRQQMSPRRVGGADVLELVGRALAPGRGFRRIASEFENQFPRCGACRAEETAQERALTLLEAALQDPPTTRLYEASHGLCVRHVLARRNASSTLPARICAARLGVLLWELEEASRKSDWLVRYEPHGSEAVAWRRAMAQIDGRVFLGNPAVTRSGRS